MKKEIYCMKCKTRVQKVIGSTLPPQEHVKYVDGKAKISMVCDFCNKPIYPPMRCCAFSNYFDGEYAPWEEKFIEASDEQKDPVPPMGVYNLLITGDKKTLDDFFYATAPVLNFLEQRLDTLHATCMSESLEYAIGVAERTGATLQYISHTEDKETYPVIVQDQFSAWGKEGY